MQRPDIIPETFACEYMVRYERFLELTFTHS
jgi:hypothetical protein